MNAAVVKRTQEALGKVIRRPPLTEKLLNKPPFRYLHDIITEVIRMTGFMKGLYTDIEMKSDNVKDKDAKISFLQKAIDVVVIVSGEPLSAKPARIVAGHEPERTNELLQRIGKCCLSKLSSDDAVKRVLAGEKGDVKGRPSLTSRPQELDNKNVREDESRVRKDKEDRGNSEINERSTSRDQKQKEELKEESKPREKERDKDKAKENERDRHKEPERDRHREGDRERAKNRARTDRERERDRGPRERDKDAERRSDGGKEKERERERERRRLRNGEPERSREGERNRPEKKSSSSGEMSKKLSDGSFKDPKAETETEISTRASRSVTTKTSKRRSKNSVEGRRDSRTSENSLSPEKEHNSSYSKAKKEHTVKQFDDNAASLWRGSAESEPAVKQKGDCPSDAEFAVGPAACPERDIGAPGQEKSEAPENPEPPPGELPAAVRRIPRPGSARPAPPRVRRQESVEALTTDRTGSGKTVSNVITESQNSDNEDDDQFVVEAAPQLPEMSELEMAQAVELEEDEKHGEAARLRVGLEEGEGHRLQGDREAPGVHPDPVPERPPPGQDHGLHPGGRGRHAERAAAVAQREPAACRGPAAGAEHHGQRRGAPEGGAGGAGAAGQGPAGQDLCREGQHPEERGEDPEDGVQHQPEFQEVRAQSCRDSRGSLNLHVRRRLALRSPCEVSV
ncbi:TRAF3-interacting protein 1 isoform X1 [Cervus elaphus]|uniref:TRAF3-interacting protein 1 isoform X1 n=1 Tax=Cervus elaphus TaxID=9860 RepID=UPI001CC2A5FF|nr:TRAF3-interacting protein 1 isoform X1 [Cervus elaphus]